MKYIATPTADVAAEIICRAWGAKRQRNSNAFLGEPAYAYKITRREKPVLYKAYVGEMQWTIEAQGQQVMGKRFELSFGEPFKAMCLTAPCEICGEINGLAVFSFPRINGSESDYSEHNAWLLSQAAFIDRLRTMKLVAGETLAVTARCLFVQLRMGDAADVERRLNVFKEMLAWLRSVAEQPEHVRS